MNKKAWPLLGRITFRVEVETRDLQTMTGRRAWPQKLACWRLHTKRKWKTLKRKISEALQNLVDLENANVEMQEAYLKQRVSMRKAEKAKTLRNFRSPGAKKEQCVLHEVADG